MDAAVCEGLGAVGPCWNTSQGRREVSIEPDCLGNFSDSRAMEGYGDDNIDVHSHTMLEVLSGCQGVYTHFWGHSSAKLQDSLL